jgi:hypothetical protein
MLAHDCKAEFAAHGFKLRDADAAGSGKPGERVRSAAEFWEKYFK